MKMHRVVVALVLLALLVVACDNPFFPQRESFITRFESSNGLESATYDEVIAFYKELSKEYSDISLKTMGMTDSGLPLHIVIYNSDADFNFAKIRQQKTIILINNAIHAGEPDGIDATMLLMRNLAQEQIKVPENVVVVAIPVYNIDGALNRNSTTRVNQQGPEAYGFRGNAKNLDLNRDFIKADSENALSFAKIFQLVQPDIFIDNHVTNGADYQYVLTYGTSQPDKLGKHLGSFLRDTLIPQVSDTLVKKSQLLQNDSIASPFWKLVPYVNVWNKPPDADGYNEMLDTPRYSTGYATLWNTMGILIETHMLKPFKERVEANYEMMKTLVEFANHNSNTIKELRQLQTNEIASLKTYPIDWQIDSTQVKTLQFHGYKADTLPSEITGMPRLRYDRTQPYTKDIPYYNTYIPSKEITVPNAYIVPNAWQNIIQRLKANKVLMTEVPKDSTMLLHYYRIESYTTSATPYEGHYLHHNTKVSIHTDSITLRKGDWIIPTDQPAKRYLLETLEPEAPDSFFNWNFFDTVLQRKEGFSPYVFEEIAQQFLEDNPAIKDSFFLKKAKDPNFAKNAYAQLNWIYEQTPHHEKNYRRYPVYFLPE
ncbi:MAG: M14 family metallopeptidase [Capnocytophaga sp.]|nr:M14 family metallopeptidase [Capnocytophaga sp.]